jgi:fructokinase
MNRIKVFARRIRFYKNQVRVKKIFFHAGTILRLFAAFGTLIIIMLAMPASDHSPAIICFGETLWTAMPSGSIPGGAPMNLAYHLKKMGMEPILITRVGQDDLGKRMVNLVDGYDISTEFFQVDFDLGTGQVNIDRREQDGPVYDIRYPAAWDKISWDKDFEKLLAGISYFVFGNLACRSTLSRETLFRLAALARFRIFNVYSGPHGLNRSVMEHLLPDTHLLKVGLDELELMTGWFAGYRHEEDRIKLIQDKFNIQHVIVTKGIQGVTWRTGQTLYRYSSPLAAPVNEGTDNEAFLAAVISKLIDRAPPEEILDLACRLHAFIASCETIYPDYAIEKPLNRIRSFWNADNLKD